ncbi:hypothetical protein AAMO2058_001683100 [Amorphochlora amoebiformis]
MPARRYIISGLRGAMVLWLIYAASCTTASVCKRVPVMSRLPLHFSRENGIRRTAGSHSRSLRRPSFESMATVPWEECSEPPKYVLRKPRLREGGRATRKMGINQMIQAASSGEDALTVIETAYQKLSPINAVTCLHTIAKKHPTFLQQTHDSKVQYQWKLLSHSLKSSINLLDCRGIATAIWAFGRLSVSMEDTLKKPIIPDLLEVPNEIRTGYRDRALDMLPETEIRSLASVLWGFAQVAHIPPRKFLESAEKQFVMGFVEANPHTLTSTMWAFASLRHKLSTTSLKHFEEASMGVIKAFNSQDISNTIWSMAILQQAPSREFHLSIQDAALNQVTRLEPQGVANILWGLAKLASGEKSTRVRPEPRLLAALEKRALQTLGLFNAQAISNTLWAFGTIRHRPNGKLAQAMQLRAISVLGRCTPQGVANILWALAQLESKPLQILSDDVNDRLIKNINLYPPQAISLIVWSFARLNLPVSRKLQNKLTTRIIAAADEFQPQAISNLLWAFSKFENYPEVRLLNALKKQVYKKHEILSLQGTVNILWALRKLMRHPVGRVTQSLKRRLIDTSNTTNIHGSSISNALKDRRVSKSLQKSIDLDIKLVECLHNRALHLADEWDPQSISSLYWSVSRTPQPIGSSGEALLTELETQAEKLSERFSVRQVAVCVHAMASLVYHPSDRFQNVFGNAVKSITVGVEIGKEAAVMTTWALEVLDWKNPSF